MPCRPRRTGRLYFTNLYRNINKYNICREKYYLPDLPFENQDKVKAEVVKDERRPRIILETLKKKKVVEDPTACVWQFMKENEVLELLKLEEHQEIYNFIKTKFDDFRTGGIPKIIIIELLVSAALFSKRNKFTPEQTGAMLAIFYNTHLNFLLDLWCLPEKIYEYFKKILISHSISFEPKKVRIFTSLEIKLIVTHFHNIYIRNLPLVRLLTLPQYNLKLTSKDNPIDDELMQNVKPKRKKGKKDKSIK